MDNQIYSIVEGFVKEVEQDKKHVLLVKNWHGKRGPKRKLSITQVMWLNLLRFSLHIKDLKAFHRVAKDMNFIANMPNYENFLKASNKAFPILTVFMEFLLFQNRVKNGSGFHFMDSTSVSTCLNRRIFTHKVTKDFASRGKTTKGWFYGFKLHGVCSENGLLESIVFTSGNVNDGKMVEQVTKNLTGSFFCDAGYIKKSEELVKLAETGRFIHAASRKNMKKLMSVDQWTHLRRRNIIESNWGVLKQNYFLEYHQARCITGLFRHYVTCISAYILHSRFKSSTRIKTRI